jgi:histidyl-tRNA synthetase
VSSSHQAPRGTYDVLPADAERRERVEAEARRILGAAGYRRIETPIFEATDLFARGVGESTDIVQKEMYTFDDGGGRSLTLRPEGTAPICRAYLEHGMHKLPQPVRVWYLGPFFRRERAQAGRYRQFWQVGAEAIGSDAPGVDAELILLHADLLTALEVRDVRLRLNSLGSPATREGYREALLAYLHAHADDLHPEVRARIELNPLRAFDSADPSTQAVMAGAPKLYDALVGEDREHFEEVKAHLEDAGQRYELDTSLVRGIDYYRRTIFEFTSDRLGAQSGVGGGGRYDGLIELLGGPPTPGCGWAAGIERMLMASAESGGPAPAPPPVDLFVAIAKPERRRVAWALAQEARRAGLAAQLESAGRSVKGQMKHADRLGARYVAIVEEAGVTLKDMESGEQQHMAAADLVLRAILRPSA